MIFELFTISELQNSKFADFDWSEGVNMSLVCVVNLDLNSVET